MDINRAIGKTRAARNTFAREWVRQTLWDTIKGKRKTGSVILFFWNGPPRDRSDLGVGVDLEQSHWKSELLKTRRPRDPASDKF